jgi:hypothetical protein
MSRMKITIVADTDVADALSDNDIERAVGGALDRIMVTLDEIDVEWGEDDE